MLFHGVVLCNYSEAVKRKSYQVGGCTIQALDLVKIGLFYVRKLRRFTGKFNYHQSIWYFLGVKNLTSQFALDWKKTDVCIPGITSPFPINLCPQKATSGQTIYIYIFYFFFLEVLAHPLLQAEHWNIGVTLHSPREGLAGW